MGSFNAGSASYGIKTTRREVVHLYNRVVLGSAGAVASQDLPAEAGFVVSQVDSEAGRFRCTLVGGIAAKILFADVKLIGADDTAYTSTKGLDVLCRNNEIATNGSAYIDVQTVRTDTAADADPEDSLTAMFMLVIQLV